MPDDGRKAYPLRVDPALWAAVERSAAADLRSVNAQVECLLREALGARGVRLKAPTLRKRGRPPREKPNE
ncbi:MAG: toxin-antitoxin system HicB family antitoxin [Sphingomicrobium sp.]